MIYAIAAMDSKNGVANQDGIPWKLRADQLYFREKTKGSILLFGYGYYHEAKQPLPDRRNIVIVRPGTEPLREGFERTEDAEALLDQYEHSPEVIWVAGGAQVYHDLLHRVQKLYLTRINKDFSCTKFFPPFEDQFVLADQSEVQHENGLDFCYQVWDSQPKLK